MNRQKKGNQRAKRSQKGGGSSDFVGSFHAYGADPAQLSRFTLNSINQAPMFNPLKLNTVIPTGTSGIIPTGSYYNAMAPVSFKNSLGPPTPGFAQMGGRKEGASKNPWIAHVREFADKHGISYGNALKDPHVKDGYRKKK